MSEFRYDTDLVRALLRDQHPDLADLELRDVDGGWDNQMWRLGDELAVRLPRTERAPALLHIEQTWLPVVAGPPAVADAHPGARGPTLESVRTHLDDRTLGRW